MDNALDRNIDVTAILFLLVQNRQQTHVRTLIGSSANGLGIQEHGMFIVYTEKMFIISNLYSLLLCGINGINAIESHACIVQVTRCKLKHEIQYFTLPDII